MEYMSVLLTVVFGLMVVTNIVTEVLKKVTWSKIPTNLMVLIISEVLTLIAGAAYASIKDITIVWYYVVGAVVVGVFVSYSAMFGFDKLRQAFEQIKDIKTDNK
jgi:Na+/glutamate symporter